MKLDFDKHRDIWGPIFTEHLQSWGKYILDPSLELIIKGKLVYAKEGIKPTIFPTLAYKSNLTEKGLQCQLLEDEESISKNIRFFDIAADEYQLAVWPFKAPIIQRVFEVIQPLIPSNTRILDCACGPGYEALCLAKLAYESEVIGIDLSKEMIKQAFRNAKNDNICNVGFYQFDASYCPNGWEHSFDLIFCQLSCSYFRDLRQVAKNHYNLLQSQGSVILIEPYPNIQNAVSMDLLKAANPLFNRYYDKETFYEIYREMGFTLFYNEEILPDIGLFIISK